MATKTRKPKAKLTAITKHLIENLTDTAVRSILRETHRMLIGIKYGSRPDLSKADVPMIQEMRRAIKRRFAKEAKQSKAGLR